MMDFADMDLAMAGLPPNKMGLESPPNNAMPSSFIGSKLWDKTITYDPDFAVRKVNKLQFIDVKNIPIQTWFQIYGAPSIKTPNKIIHTPEGPPSR